MKSRTASRIILLAASVLLSLAPPASASFFTSKEGWIGAAAGGVAGGVIGYQSGEELEGALLGSLAGFAIGTTVHRQKQRQKQLEREQELRRQLIALQQQHQTAERQGASEFSPARESHRPRSLTKSEEQQLLLQASPLFTVRPKE